MKLRSILFAAATFAVTSPVLAEPQPLMDAPPAWVKPVPIPQGTAAGGDQSGVAMLLFDRQVKLQGPESWTYLETAMRVTSAEALASASSLKLDWHPDRGALHIHKVELIRDGKSIDILATGQKFSVLRRERALEQAWLDGVLTATMQIEGVRVGDIVHVVASITISDPALGGHGEAMQPLLPPTLQAGSLRLRMLWPDSSPVQWRANNPAIQPQISKTGGMTELLVLGSVDVGDRPADAPARFRQLALVQLSNFDSWKQVSSISAPLYATDAALPPASPLRAEIDRIAKLSPDKRIRAAAALRSVQDNIRYLFNGMANGNYVPQKAEETWARRYGDCKAKTMLLLTMLRALGIDAEPVLVSSANGDAVPTYLPAFSAFDHVIARATIDGKSLWLDGTLIGTRIADLDDVPAFGSVLPVRTAGSDLEKLTPTPPARPLTTVSEEIDASAGLMLPATFKATISLRGQEATMFRFAQTAVGKEKFGEMVDQFVGALLTGRTITSRSFSFDENSGAAVVTASGVGDSAWSVIESRKRYVPESVFTNIALGADRSAPAKKDVPVTVAFPNSSTYSMRMTLPRHGDGFTVEGEPKHVWTIGGVEVGRDARIEAGVFMLDQRARALTTEIAAASLPEARAALARAQGVPLRVVAPDGYPDKKPEIAEAKKTQALKPLIAAYDLSVANANTAGRENALSTRATFFEDIGETAKARADVDRLIAVQPTVDRYIWRARLAQDSDTQRALADLLAARALDPQSNDLINALTNLRIKRKEYEIALKELDDASASGMDKADVLTLRASVLGDSGKVDDGLALLKQAIDIAPGKPALLNAMCWMKATHKVSLDTALKDCTKAIGLIEKPTDALDSRGFVYLRLDRYEEAISDFDAALKLDPEHAPSLFARGIARLRSGDKAGGEKDLAAARLITKDIDTEYARYGVTP